MVVAYSMMLRLSNDGHVYHVMLTYIALDLSLDEPEEFIEKIKAVAPDGEKGIVVQVVDANCIAGREHLIEVLTQSLEAERRSCMLARKVEVDIMLRLACTRQISDAIERVGLKKESRMALLIAIASEGVHHRREDEGEKGRSYYHNLLMAFKDRLKEVDGVKRVYDYDEVGVGRGEEEEESSSSSIHAYEHLASVYGVSEQELASCIVPDGNRLASILAERANLLHR
ncbi:MAG: KEOPS complex subunit Cgi121 [Candidatus Nitrosocaldus sp.]